MNLGQLVELVKSEFGDSAGAQITNDLITSWVNVASQKIQREVKYLTELLVSGVSGITGISDYYAVHDVFILEGSVYIPLSRINRLELIIKLRDGATGKPTYYNAYKSSTGLVVDLYPTPDVTSYDYKIRGAARPTEIAVYGAGTALNLPTEYHSTVVLYCLMRAAKLDDDAVRAQQYQSEFDFELADAAESTSNSDGRSYAVVRDYEEDSVVW